MNGFRILDSEDPGFAEHRSGVAAVGLRCLECTVHAGPTDAAGLERGRQSMGDGVARALGRGEVTRLQCPLGYNQLAAPCGGQGAQEQPKDDNVSYR